MQAVEQRYGKLTSQKNRSEKGVKKLLSLQVSEKILKKVEKNFTFFWVKFYYIFGPFLTKKYVILMIF